MKSFGWCWAMTCQLTPLLTLYWRSTARSTVSAWSSAALQLSVCDTLPICSTNMILLEEKDVERMVTDCIDDWNEQENEIMSWIVFIAIPSTGQIQRSSDGLSDLAAVEVQRVPVSVRRELTASAAHTAALNQTPALLRHRTRLKVILYRAWQLTAGQRAVITWERQKLFLFVLL